MCAGKACAETLETHLVHGLCKIPSGLGCAVAPPVQRIGCVPRLLGVQVCCFHQGTRQRLFLKHKVASLAVQLFAHRPNSACIRVLLTAPLLAKTIHCKHHQYPCKGLVCSSNLTAGKMSR